MREQRETFERTPRDQAISVGGKVQKGCATGTCLRLKEINTSGLTASLERGANKSKVSGKEREIQQAAGESGTQTVLEWETGSRIHKKREIDPKKKAKKEGGIVRMASTGAS